MNINQLLEALNQRVEIHKQQPQFFAHVNTERMEIIAIGPDDAHDDIIDSIPLQYDLAVKLLNGEEQLSDWVVGKKDDNLQVMRLKDNPEFLRSRIDSIQIKQLHPTIIDDCDVRLELVKHLDVVRIHYNGDRVKSWARPLRLYFTKEDDPSYLKCAFMLDVNILEALTEFNQLSQWPNPIVFPIDHIDDISIFTTKSNLKISVELS